MRIISNCELATKKIAVRLSEYLQPGDCLALVGDLGAGKTIFVKGLSQGFGYNCNKVTSSSFVLLQVYETKKVKLYHLDLYRLKSIDDLYHLGYEEFIFGDNITVIEWPQLAFKLLGKDYLEIKFKIVGQTKRELTFCPHGARFRKIIKKFN
jgi:tRNA threonylcarbamoyladenosine biosynthesis protein TsaE